MRRKNIRSVAPDPGVGGQPHAECAAQPEENSGGTKVAQRQIAFVGSFSFLKRIADENKK